MRQKFGSKQRDETGLDFFEARYFSSIQGRFTSPDDFAGGPTELFAVVAAHNPTFYADIAEPQSLNKYSYCLNNPLKFVDPDGHQATMADALRWGAATGVALEVVPGGQAAGTAVLVVTGVAALGYAAYNTDWKAVWNGTMDALVKYGSHSDCIACDAHANDTVERQKQKAAQQNILSQSNQGGSGNQAAGNQGGANAGGASRTPHGDDRKRQADQGDSHRQIGDANRTIRDGQQYRDTQTGNNVYVRGNRVVITNQNGNIVTQFKNSRANTRERLESGRWEPVDGGSQ